MIETNILDAARADFAALDFADENARIADLEAERERMASAIERAENRCTEISQELDAYRDPNPGEHVADALLADVEPSEAATAGPSSADLIEERAKLRRGIGELRRRYDDAYNGIRLVQREAARKVSPLAPPLNQALLDKAEGHARALLDCYAALAAVEAATHCGSEASGKVAKVARGIVAHGGLIPTWGALPVPADITDALRSLEGNGKALPVSMITQATVPDDVGQFMQLAAVASREAA